MDQIRKRQQAIDWDNLPELPLDEEELDFLEYYLDYREQLSYKGAFLSFINKVDRLVKSDPLRYIVERGVLLTLTMLVRLNEWQKNLPKNSPALMKEFAEKLRMLLVSLN